MMVLQSGRRHSVHGRFNRRIGIEHIVRVHQINELFHYDGDQIHPAESVIEGFVLPFFGGLGETRRNQRLQDAPEQDGSCARV